MIVQNTPTGDLPREFQHNCPHCVFLGYVKTEEARFDVYKCSDPTGEHSPVLVMRWGTSQASERIIDLEQSYFDHWSEEFPFRYEALRQAKMLFNNNIPDFFRKGGA